MANVNNVINLLINKQHISDLHTKIVNQLRKKPHTHKQLQRNVLKEDGTQYSTSYIRRILAELQYNDIVRKEYLTHKYTFYVLNEWEVFKSTWDKRRKRIKRNVFNDVNRELPTLDEMIKQENDEYY